MRQNSGKAPSISWYYKDWLSDERLKLASLSAKGLWADIISQSVSMPKPGVFLVENESISERKLLQMFGGKQAEKRRAFNELKKLGIIKQDENKTFYVKRVKRDMELRAIRAEAGKLGGNPNLVGNSLTKEPDLLNQNSKQNSTLSNSNSNSYSKTIRTKGKISHELVLEIQKESLRLMQLLEKELGPFLPREEKTFRGLVAYLTKEARHEQDSKILSEAREMLGDKLDYCHRNGKTSLDVKRIYVAAIRERFGFKGGNGGGR